VPLESLSMAESNDNSEERPLDPTERRLQTAREEGQFPQSRDLTTLIVLVAFGATLVGMASWYGHLFIEVVRQGLTLGPPDDWERHLQQWAQGPLLRAGAWLLVLLLPVWLLSMLAPLALVRFQPVFAFKFSGARLDPVAGLGRLVSLTTLLEVVKNIAKVAVIFLVLGFYLWSLLGPLTHLPLQGLDPALAHSLNMLQVGMGLLVLPVVLAATADVFIQWRDFTRRMRMSVQEMRQEMKETEGSPELRARQRQRQRQMATSRMMSAMEKADVVLANPDHYSVALRYEAGKMTAPLVVAKGTDEVALVIQELAREHGVPIARIPALARLMHSQVKVGQTIPIALFEAVAKVLAWAYDSRERQQEAPLPQFDRLPTQEELAQR
jgi:flagellar biosynthetic protein FlhB